MFSEILDSSTVHKPPVLHSHQLRQNKGPKFVPWHNLFLAQALLSSGVRWWRQQRPQSWKCCFVARVVLKCSPRITGALMGKGLQQWPPHTHTEPGHHLRDYKQSLKAWIPKWQGCEHFCSSRIPWNLSE